MGIGGSRATPAEINKLKVEINTLVENDPVVIFSKGGCPYCRKVKALFRDLKVKYRVVSIDARPNTGAWQDALQEMTGARTVPRVFVGGESIGGCDDTFALLKDDKLYDKVVAAKKAAKEATAET